MKKLLPASLALLLAPTVHGVIIINDSFADGDRAATGPLQADFYGSSTSGAVESNAGSVGLVSGSSGRQIHAIFPTVTLANAGDSLTATVTFLTPATVASTNEDVRVGLFDHLGRGTNAAQLGQDTTYSSGTPNADYNGLHGFYSEIDVESADPATDLNMRVSDPSTSGRLLATSTGFTSLGTGPDLGYTIVPNTSYTISLTVLRNAGGDLDITTDFAGATRTSNIAAPGSFDFGMLAMGSSSGAFGSSNSAGVADNGIDITNFTVDATLAPEPSSALLLGFGALGFLARRRR